MKLVFSYLKNHKKTLGLALALAVVHQVFSLLDPQIFRLIIDNYVSRIDELSRGEFISGVLLLLLATVLVAFISRVGHAFQDYFVNVTTQKVGTEMYSDSVTHAFSLPFSVFEDQRSGEILNRMQKARLDAQNFIALSINVLFLSLVGIVFVLIYATYVHPLIGLAFFLMIPGLGSITFFLSKKIKEAQQAIVSETAALAGQTTETLRNVELVKSLGLEDREIHRLNDVNEKILALELKKVKLVRSLAFVQGTMINALRSAILFLMLWLIFQEAISLGEFFSLLFYSFIVFNPLYQLGEVAAAYQETRASSQELKKVLSLKPEAETSHLPKIEKIAEIEFREVSFSYQGAKENSLEKISLKVRSGETVALVGPSGSGKSTMVKLLAGLYQPTSGKLLVNGQALSEIDKESLRRKMSLVSQETQLFSGTIRENLLFVNPFASDEECLEVLRLASVEYIMDRGDEGLDTKIGEGGIKISGGERQRLAIARALLRKPEVIIFDEATSSLDSLTEQAITETIKKISQVRPELITILIAHRISTVIHADRIYVLQKGKLVETGSHEKLISLQEGLYNSLWKQQTNSV